MFSGMGDAGYAPLVSGDSGFYSADGTIQEQMDFSNQNEQMMFRGKNGSQDEIEHRVLMRKQEQDYEYGDYGGMGGMMNPMNPMMGYGSNPNMMGNNRRPPEINFCRDGGDTRACANGSVENDNSPMGMNPMN